MVPLTVLYITVISPFSSDWFTFFSTPRVNFQLLCSHIYQHFCLWVLVLALQVVLPHPPQGYRNIPPCGLVMREMPFSIPTLPSYPQVEALALQGHSTLPMLKEEFELNLNRKVGQKGMTFLTQCPQSLRRCSQNVNCQMKFQFNDPPQNFLLDSEAKCPAGIQAVEMLPSTLRNRTVSSETARPGHCLETSISKL